MTTGAQRLDNRGAPFDAFAATLTGIVIYSMSMQRFLLEGVPLLLRMGVGLALLALAVLGSRMRPRYLYISAPVAGLAFVMAVSLVNQPELYILLDYLAYLLALVYAVVLISVFGPRVALLGVAIGFVLLVFRNALAAVGSMEVLAGKAPLIGAFYGPNTLAASVLVLMPAVLALQFTSRKWTYSIRAIGVTSGFIIIIFTRASTELAVALLLMVFWLAFVLSAIATRRARWLLWTGVAAIPIGTVALWPSLLALRGKDPTLSGRTEIWAAYFEMIMRRPIRGYGWAIQTTWDMPLGARIAQAVGPQIHNAHNDLINWWAHTGLLGALLYIYAIALIVVASMRLQKQQFQISLWAFTTAIVMAINGLAELTSFYPDGWVVLCLVSSALAFTSVSPKSGGVGSAPFGLFAIPLPTRIRAKG